ncbi:unnamed protein product [Bursaphelenchus xylophilus]|uniref:(pine wood nematode) hypothetical protein n=1 Tax=Bursaphelenchus xylophilus TaxID=6326 RepID=A0A7I8XG43_BURXY|nr:unnamed protein product [Bursaphelenchus xylophilus]CAG9123755.1 unnamed protein product [Bursaphelenchus xylophilus]
MRLKSVWAWLLAVFCPQAVAKCTWPDADVLFVIDSTINIDSSANHRRLLELIKLELSHMKLGRDGVQISVAQFTPTAKYEFGLSAEGFEALERRINSIQYVPCQAQGEQCTRNAASLNTLLKGGLSADAANRIQSPDVMVVISTSLYQPREVNPNELLIKPSSPTHVFLITIGSAAPSTRYLNSLQFAATTTHLAALDFDSLSQLEFPLCESVNSFIGTSDSSHKSGFFKPTLCIVIIVLTAVIALVLTLCLCYAVYHYKSDVRRLEAQLRSERESSRKREEDLINRIRQRSATEKEREKTMMELINESNKIRDHYRDETARREQSMPLPVTLVEPEDVINLDDRTLSTFARSHSFPAPEHPIRVLPPVDVLLLVDSSSSIDLNSFNQVKQVLRSFVADIDIAPSRSRVAVIMFAAEPKVYFGFERYYSVRSVRTALRRMPYLGGPTFLAKALSFAAGVLYQEQNMKRVRHRHRLMPTPRHDRPQVMVVVSDGISDDAFDQEVTHLHERLMVRIAALVTKSFNRERMVPVTRYAGSVFTLDQKEALSIWLWRTQRMWNENFRSYVEREKSFNQEKTPRRNK